MRLQGNLLVCLALAAVGLAQDEPKPSKDRISAQNSNQDFNDLLNALPEESLHAALSGHLQSKFQDGVFEHHRKAVEAVHAADPPLATKLILNAAKHDLIRRQNASVPISSTSSSPVVVVPITSTTTDSSGRPTTRTTSVIAPPPTSVVVPITTTDSSGNTVTTSRTVAGIIISTTNSAGSLITSGSPVPTAGQVLTSTDSNGQSFETTYTPDGGIVSSVVLQTTTLPDGQVVTITSFAQVNPTGGPQASESSSSGGDSDLQNAAVLSFRPSILYLLGVILGAVLFM